MATGEKRKIRIKAKPTIKISNGGHKTVEQLAKEQGIKPFDASIFGKYWPADIDEAGYESYLSAVRSSD